MQVSTTLRSARRKADIGVRELARRVSVHPSHISRIESGKVPASRSLLVALSQELDLNEDTILALAGYLPAEWQRALQKNPACAGQIRESLKGAREQSSLTKDRVREPLPHYEAPAGPTPKLQDPLQGIFPAGFVPSPEINEIYELKLAMLESQLLSKDELVERGAYFISIDGVYTNHFAICTGGGVKLPNDSRSRLQSFIGTHQFKTSYATHGLFPYRGKYHPQMIKALINVMGLKPGSVVLDPMAGSGTTAIEAAVMGIDSVAVDVSPFCTFMVKTKAEALNTDTNDLMAIAKSTEKLQKIYKELCKPQSAAKVRDPYFQPRNLSRPAFNILALAFMDARGYAVRSSRKSEFEFFKDLLEKYTRTIERFRSVAHRLRLKLGNIQVIEGDARKLIIESGTIDGIIFSPPYSFAVDYLENDAQHLSYLNCPIDDLRPLMIGLNGGSGRRKVDKYFDDMALVLDEVVRVLKHGACCTVIVGSNSNQMARVLGIDPASPEARYGIEERLINMADLKGLALELKIRRLIVGMANSMREEHILVLRKGGSV